MTTDQNIPAEEQGKSKPQKTWFFQRGDGNIFACGETEAWNLLNNQSNWARRDFVMLGMSDGELYFEMLKSSRTKVSELLEEKGTLTVDRDKYLATEDRLRFKELKDENDEMVIKVVGILKDLNKKIGEIDEKLKTFNQDSINEAFNAELEKARGNMIKPDNQDIVTPTQKDREKILNNINI